MITFFDKQKLLDLMHQGALVITPNNRLSDSLLYDYFTYRKQNTLIKPQCLPYSSLLVRLFEQYRLTYCQPALPILLNELQCRFLWQTILRSTPHITYSNGLLNAVMEAWKHCEHWMLEPDDNTFASTPQTLMFKQWWLSFHQEIEKRKTLSEPQLVPYFLKNNFPLPHSSWVWVCFDELTPQQKSLQTKAQAQGISQYHFDLQSSTLTTSVCAAANKKEEFQYAIEWLKEQLLTDKTIGIVIPDLQQDSRQIKRLFSQHFDASDFNISLGEPLNEFPLVAHALSFLELHEQCTPFLAELLLQSPYLGAAQEEFIQRAALLQESKALQQAMSLTAFSQLVEKKSPRLAELLNHMTAYPKEASVAQWVELFQNRLNELHFPGDLGLNSTQYQCHQRFVALLDEFRQLAIISSYFTLNEALNALGQLASHTIFQVQKNKAPIQISGLLEASGCEFNSLWVMGLTDACLPAKPRLSAFIPIALQRELEMPHSTPHRELHFAETTLLRLQKGSQKIVFSYSKLENDTPNLPCALIKGFPAYLSSGQNVIKPEPAVLQSIEEDFIVSVHPQEILTGGTSLLGNQAKCPFKAFAEHRLHAKPQPKPIEGIDKKERGTILHRIMELIWTELKSQSRLLQMESLQLEELVVSAINKALSDPQKQLKNELLMALKPIESIRLKRLILDTLEWEKQRPAFIIDALEQAYSINLSGLEIKIRVDRLDRVESNTWVIDYKSTLPTSKPWNEDRPQEPQLLLYALINETINTILFMQIKTGQILCSGLGENKSDIRGLSHLKKEETWTETRAHWHEQLNTLAQEILQGQCIPNPVNKTLCTQCDFKNLCRMS